MRKLKWRLRDSTCRQDYARTRTEAHFEAGPLQKNTQHYRRSTEEAAMLRKHLCCKEVESQSVKRVQKNRRDSGMWIGVCYTVSHLAVSGQNYLVPVLQGFPAASSLY
jgi:hypothetical protein